MFVFLLVFLKQISCHKFYQQLPCCHSWIFFISKKKKKKEINTFYERLSALSNKCLATQKIICFQQRKNVSWNARSKETVKSKSQLHVAPHIVLWFKVNLWEFSRYMPVCLFMLNRWGFMWVLTEMTKLLQLKQMAWLWSSISSTHPAWAVTQPLLFFFFFFTDYTTYT